MTRHRERFHQAAKDNYLDLLREATRSECDAVDDNNMTPVMWAAFYGHLDALRVLMGRGANPDRADHMGSTALHFAALNGHMNCVTYLVNFGANIWSLDVDCHSALDLAALGEHKEIVDFLDGIAGQQAEQNKRTVAKLRERAALDAQKRAKKLDKLMKKADKRSAKEGGTDSCGLHSTASNPNYRHATAPSAASAAAASDGVSVVLERTNRTAQPFSKFIAGSPSANSTAAGANSSAFFGSAPSPMPPRNSADVDILYARSADSRSLVSAAAAEAPSRGAVPGLFERPGFGNVTFLQATQPQSPQSPQLPQSPNLLYPLSPASPTRTLGGESIGTSASLTLRPWREMPWTEPEVATLAPDYDVDGLDNVDGGEPSAMETFLDCLGLAEYNHLLTRERLDLDGLVQCTEADLQDLGLPLGPRRRLLEGLARRREVLANPPQSMLDLRF